MSMCAKGDMGFDPLGIGRQHFSRVFSTVTLSSKCTRALTFENFVSLGIGSWDICNMNFLREAEIKHGRVAMLGFAGIMVESAGIKFPGVADTLGGSNDIFEIHNAAVAKVPDSSVCVKKSM